MKLKSFTGSNAPTCSACGGTGMGPAMYRPEIDKTQRDRCYTCKGTGAKPPTSPGKLQPCPFCGGTGGMWDTWKGWIDHTPNCWVLTVDCSHGVTQKLFGETLLGWNRRARQIKKQNAELRDRSGSGTPIQDQPSKLP